MFRDLGSYPQTHQSPSPSLASRMPGALGNFRTGHGAQHVGLSFAQAGLAQKLPFDANARPAGS